MGSTISPVKQRKSVNSTAKSNPSFHYNTSERGLLQPNQVDKPSFTKKANILVKLCKESIHPSRNLVKATRIR